MSIGVWSLAWSPADSIVAAGTSRPGIILYDLAAERRLTAAACHHDDVNAVAFADAGGNLLVSGSDDSRLFLHDRCATHPSSTYVECVQVTVTVTYPHCNSQSCVL